MARATRLNPRQTRTDVGNIPGSSPLSAVAGRLRRGMENVVLAVLGDSTGNQTFEWVYLTALWLAVRYPAYTVLYRLWNDTNQNYDAAVTVSTGTGSKTLTIYNASMPGALASYSTPKLALQLPVTPQAVVVSYGHNSSSTTARLDNYTLIRALREACPFAAIVMTAQNPRAASDADYVNGLARQQSNIDLAQTEGLGVINVMQAFLDNPNYAADWLDPDGLHPNAAGMQVWRNEVVKHFRDDGVVIPQGPISDNRSEVWIPASAFVAKTGSPVRVDTSDLGPYWALPNAGTTAIHTQLAVPPSWDHMSFYAKWLQTTTSGLTASNNVFRIITSVRGFGAPAGYANAPAAAPTTALGGLAATNPSGSNSAAGVRTSNLGQTRPIGFGIGNILALEIKRLGDDAADTNADEFRLLGVMAVRQS